MSIKERKEREKEEMRALILNTAKDIIKTEGIDKLSIRKIAGMIDYSPAIIYHYYKDKDEIINNAMKEGYKKIVDGLSEVQLSNLKPEERLEAVIRTYIKMALENPEEYKNVQLSDSTKALGYTVSLFKGASEQKPALNILCSCIKDANKELDNSTAELMAQIIYTSSFGLIIRLIIENDIDEEQRNNLIEQYIKFIKGGML